MLVGDPPHLGSTAQAIIAKVLTERPPSVQVARPSVPEHVAYAVERALEKLSADRWRTAGEFDASLTGRTGPVNIPTSYRTSARMAATARAGVFARVLGSPMVAAVVGVVALACAAGWWIAARRTAAVVSVRLTLENPPGGHIAASGDAFALAPDGLTLVFVGELGAGKRQLFVRTLADVTPRPLAGTENATSPFFSPDGKWVGFVADRQIKKILVAGGSVVPLAEVGDTYTASWGEAGSIAVSAGGRVLLVPENGGPPKAMAGPDSAAQRAERWPLFINGGDAILYTSWGGQATDAKIMARRITTGSAAEIGITGAVAVAVVDGFLFYANGAGRCSRCVSMSSS
jgi:serine/threonine-protein kinase